jgi:hypothetical protein
MEDLLFARRKNGNLKKGNQINVSISGELWFIKVRSVDMYFVRYIGSEETYPEWIYHETSADQSIFAWKHDKNSKRRCTVLQ